ncbi:MFS transporter [Actinocorallia sp. A-T 12471]|uniref:MFS transporter n=1 Tax=Actinocorallia sp. A-T 12471 TaxID=3089813 RepID=UPI0029CD6914|nr:MFS transporter [Actinocorallia sp. A-T 12471]MDX6742211.1 MFS transporter [Actinocorallia sp. A-T 12471]
MSVARTTGEHRSPGLMLALATIGFAVNFWAWSLLSPLASRFKESLGLSPFQQSLLVAVPVIVGSLGRIPVGLLTDRYGGRVMFTAVSAITIVPVLCLAWFGVDSFAGLLVFGFLLGVGGTAFAVGVPFVNAWFPPERRGTAIGIFGMGMGGTAISAFTTVRLADAWGLPSPFLLTAVVLAVYAVVAWFALRDSPARPVPSGSALAGLKETCRLGVTWQASALYAVAFGGYVAFSVYLPTYLENAYKLTPPDASNRMAGFVILAVLMRPVGGWLSDRIGAVKVLTVAMVAVTIGAAIQAFTPPLMPLGTFAFLLMAAALGAGSGAVFALVALLAPAGKVGGVTGVVGAAGGLGGFVPPLVMGAVYGATGGYGIGLALLAVVGAAAALFTGTWVRKAVARRTTKGGGGGR